MVRLAAIFRSMVGRLLTAAYLHVLVFPVFVALTVADQNGAEQTGGAASAGAWLFLDCEIRSEFEPQSGYVYGAFSNGGAFRVAAVVVSPGASRVKEDSRSGKLNMWRLGASVKAPEGAVAVMWLGEIMDGSSHAYSEVHERAFDHPLWFEGQVEKLRAQMLSRKENLQSLQIQERAQEDSLRRLRADADIIADLGRIVDVREDIDRIKSAIADAEQDIGKLDEFVRLVKVRGSAKNMVARERQLSRHVLEIAEATKQVEAEEFSRRSQAERELQDRLALVELARTTDFDSLQRELVRVRKERVDLQARLARPQT